MSMVATEERLLACASAYGIAEYIPAAFSL